MTTDQLTVLGRPVTGDITPPTQEHDVEQWPGERFEPLLDALLNLPEVGSVRWRQYTPYFNDGEPCIFGISGVSITLRPSAAPTDDAAIADGLGDEDEDEQTIESWEMYNRSGARTEPGFESIHPVLKELEDNMDHFETFLLESFGDHATVTATREGFSVEFYEHD